MPSLVIKQGETEQIRIPNVRDANGVLITNWAGYSVKAQVRDRPESATVLHEWTSVGPSANVAFAGSDIVLSIPAATSAAWSWTQGQFDAELTNPSGNIARIVDRLHLIISREITR